MNDSTDVTKLMLPQVREALPYAGVDPPEVLAQRIGISPDKVVKLNGNENPYGTSPRVAKALADYSAYNIYPDPRQGRLRKALAEYAGSEPERIVAGAGSDEIIDLLLRLFVGPGDQVIRFSPGFEMYSAFTHLVGGRMVSIPLDETFDVDVEEARRAADHENAKVLFLTVPNNPTGNLFSEDTVRSLLELNILVVVDEAYHEFSKTTMAHLLPEYPNLVVLRTSSKWAGLAGLRIGYGIMSPEVAERMLVIKPPYNVSIAAEIALYATLEDKELLLSRVDEIVRQRDALFSRLQGMTGLSPVPSHANFILCRIQGGNGMYVYEELAKRGIFVRYYNNPQLQDYIRISVGLPEHNQALVEALQDILS